MRMNRNVKKPKIVTENSDGSFYDGGQLLFRLVLAVWLHAPPPPSGPGGVGDSMISVVVDRYLQNDHSFTPFQWFTVCLIVYLSRAHFCFALIFVFDFICQHRLANRQTATPTHLMSTGDSTGFDVVNYVLINSDENKTKKKNNNKA